MKSAAHGATVAWVHDEAVGLGDVEEVVRGTQLSPKRALERLIAERLLSRYAAEKGYGEDRASERALKAARARALLLSIEQEITPESIAPEAVTQRFGNLRKVLDRDEARAVTHVLWKLAPGAPKQQARELAEATLGRLKLAADLSAAREQLMGFAEESQIDGVTRKRESFPVYADTKRFVKPFVEAVFTVSAAGVVPRVVETSHGFHVILVEEITPALPAQLADHERAIRERLALEARGVRVNELLAELSKSASITYHEEAIERAFASESLRIGPP